MAVSWSCHHATRYFAGCFKFIFLLFCRLFAFVVSVHFGFIWLSSLVWDCRTGGFSRVCVCCALSSVFLFKSCRFIIGIYGLFFLLSLEIYGKSIQGIVFQGKVVGQIAPIYKLLVFVQLSAKMSTLAHIHSHTNFYKEFAHKVGRPAQLSCKTAYSFRPCYKITQFKGRRNDDTFMEEDEKQISDLQSELIRSWLFQRERFFNIGYPYIFIYTKREGSERFVTSLQRQENTLINLRRELSWEGAVVYALIVWELVPNLRRLNILRLLLHTSADSLPLQKRFGIVECSTGINPGGKAMQAI